MVTAHSPLLPMGWTGLLHSNSFLILLISSPLPERFGPLKTQPVRHSGDKKKNWIIRKHSIMESLQEEFNALLQHVQKKVSEAQQNE
jgi:hypothetical protein